MPPKAVSLRDLLFALISSVLIVTKGPLLLWLLSLFAVLEIMSRPLRSLSKRNYPVSKFLHSPSHNTDLLIDR